MVISTEFLVTAGAFATLGGIVVGFGKNASATIEWFQNQLQASRDKRQGQRQGDLAWADTLIDTLQAQVAEQTMLADKAVATSHQRLEELAELKAWARMAAIVLMRHRLTHLVDPPPGWNGGAPWPTDPPPPPSSN